MKMICILEKVKNVAMAWTSIAEGRERENGEWSDMKWNLNDCTINIVTL
jgi:hypothetical protein